MSLTYAVKKGPRRTFLVLPVMRATVFLEAILDDYFVLLAMFLADGRESEGEIEESRQISRMESYLWVWEGRKEGTKNGKWLFWLNSCAFAV